MTLTYPEVIPARWEYSVVRTALNEGDFEDVLYRYGGTNWELVSVTVDPANPGDLIYFFKRPKSETQ